MPNNMDYERLFQQPPEGEDVYRKIERCEKTIRTIRRAVLMRLLLTALLLYIPFAARLSAGVTALILLVVLLNASGLLPLIGQWRLKKKALDKLLDEEE